MRKNRRGRGNLRINSGCSMTWRVDKTTLSGMSIPIALQQCNMYAYNRPNEDDDMLSNGKSLDLTMLNTLANMVYVSDIISEPNGGGSIHYDSQQRLYWATKTVKAVSSDPERMYGLMQTQFC